MKIFFIHLLKYISFILSFFCILILSFISIFQAGEKNFPEGNTNIAFVLDVSQSMLVQDTGKNTRLNFSKIKVQKIISQYQGADFSLNIFAGESQRILPFSSDVTLFYTFLQGLNHTNISKQGTNISEALQDAIAGFGEDKTGTIILLSDGPEENIILNKEIISQFKQQQLHIIIVGVGTEKGGYILTGDMFQPYKMYQGKKVISQLQKQHLMNIASQLDGSYVNYTDLVDLGSIKQRTNTDNKNILFYIASIFWFLFIVVCIFEKYRK